MSTVLIISDTQAPAVHPDAVEFLTALKKTYKPERVIHIGDEMDLHNFSKYTHNPDLPGVADEIEDGLAFMHELYRLFPECQVCISNHGIRPYERAMEAGIPRSMMRSYKEWMQAPDTWTWHSKIEYDNVVYIHGEGLSGDGARLKACTLMQKSVVFGHLHTHAGVSWFSTREKLLFGFNVGSLIDPKSPYFDYGKHQLQRPIIGTGIIQEGIPIFIPMELDKDARWVHRANKTKRKDYKKPTCSKCQSNNINFRGRDNGKQRIECYDCNRWSYL